MVQFPFRAIGIRGGMPRNLQWKRTNKRYLSRVISHWAFRIKSQWDSIRNARFSDPQNLFRILSHGALTEVIRYTTRSHGRQNIRDRIWSWRRRGRGRAGAWKQDWECAWEGIGVIFDFINIVLDLISLLLFCCFEKGAFLREVWFELSFYSLRPKI